MSAAAVLLFFAAVMITGALVAWKTILPAPRDFRRDDFELNGWTDWKREQEGRSGDAADTL
jgi:hypothetical protein